MKEFALIFRNETANEEKLTPADVTALTEAWGNWVGRIAASGQLVSPGSRLGFDGRIVKPGNAVTGGLYAEVRETARGFHIVKTNSLEDATEIAKGCPILNIGGNVEVRDIIPMNAN
jgi:hypothetical protein